MNVMKMRTRHVALYVIHLIAIFAIGSSDNPLTEGNNLEYDNLQPGLSLNVSNSVIKSIGKNFISSPLITSLNLEGSEIESVENGAFDRLPNLEYLNMARNKITNLFSFGDHANLRTLILANQSTYYEQELTFSGRYPQLRYLYLSGNNINSMRYTTRSNDYYEVSTQKIYDTCPELTFLDLSHNRISRWFYREYEGTTLNLTHLFLHNNNLDSVNLRSFKNLVVLTVDNNKLKTLEQNYCNDYSLCVNDMERLKYFSISNNQLFQINYHFFKSMPQLTMLNLSNNQLTDIVFDDLNSLEDLDIGNNQLTNISLFKRPMQLSRLSLDQNNIEYIGSKDLIRIANLTKLYLNDNNIKNIHQEAFWSLELLEELHLANNDLTILPTDWSIYLISLRYLNLANNKFISLEYLSLSHTLSLINIDFMNNPLVSLTPNILRDIPQNVTIRLLEDQRNLALKRSVRHKIAKKRDVWFDLANN